MTEDICIALKLVVVWDAYDPIRDARARHQKTEEGRLDHRDAQRRYREKDDSVTDHSHKNLPSFVEVSLSLQKTNSEKEEIDVNTSGNTPKRPRNTHIGAEGWTRSILKARLAHRCSHPRALPTLLESLSMWQGEKIYAVLLADDPENSSDTSLYTDCFGVFEHTPLYQMALMGQSEKRVPRKRIDGLGHFADLYRLLLERGCQ